MPLWTSRSSIVFLSPCFRGAYSASSPRCSLKRFSYPLVLEGHTASLISNVLAMSFSHPLDLEGHTAQIAVSALSHPFSHPLDLEGHTADQTKFCNAVILSYPLVLEGHTASSFVSPYDLRFLIPLF